jgi:hypothetical protein
MYKPETIVAFKEMYVKRKSTVDYLIKFRNPYEKALGTMIKNVATGVSA